VSIEEAVAELQRRLDAIDRQEQCELRKTHVWQKADDIEFEAIRCTRCGTVRRPTH